MKSHWAVDIKDDYRRVRRRPAIAICGEWRQCAASYASRTAWLIRPREETSWPFAAAHSRILPSSSNAVGGGVASVCRVVRIANGLADPAAGGDLVAVGCGPLADLAQLLACRRTVTGGGLSCGPPSEI